MQGITDAEIRQLIASVDYSEALTLTAGESEVRAACRDAIRYGFRAVVAFPQYLGVLVEELKGSHVRAQILVGFPCGGVTTHVKCTEAEEGLKLGATDLDMVMNLSAFKAGHYNQVADDIAAVLAFTMSARSRTLFASLSVNSGGTISISRSVLALAIIMLRTYSGSCLNASDLARRSSTNKRAAVSGISFLKGV